MLNFYTEVKDAGIIEVSQAEEGNLRYDYFFSAERDNEILILEKWKDRASQVYHDGLPHILRLMELKGKYGIETEIEEL
ncbi:MAG: putative quinol monooxygenase [Emergencia sp.]